MGESLPEILPSLCVEMRAPQQGHELVAAVGLRSRAGQKGKQSGERLAGQIDVTLSPRVTFCNFHGPPSKIHAPVTA